ncbi:hypothetical protein EDD15DRAFT_2201671 [Pisolithus albus]|nr:hypothetical protein EDD15DRAFT_2201671 [Pisolithus albus]
MPLCNCLAVENPGNDPLQGVECLILEEEVKPPEGGQKGGIPKLPREALSLEAPVGDWIKFIHTYQNGYNGSDESSELLKMFPGMLGVSEHPDDDEWEISPPTAQLVRGFLLYERLAPVPRGSYDQMVWFWELVRLLTAKGHYRALLDCAEVAPRDSTHVPWAGMADIAAYLAANGITPHDADDALEGHYRALLDCAEVAPRDGTHVPWAGMADIAAYLAANGITPHDADDALEGHYRALLDCAEVAPRDSTHVPWEGESDIAAYLAANGVTPHDADDALVWARSTGNEYITHAVNNGGEWDPNLRAALDLLRVAINDPLVMKENCSKEWVECQARTLGIATEHIVAYEACPLSDAELPIIRDSVPQWFSMTYPTIQGWKVRFRGRELLIKMRSPRRAR